MKHKKITIVKLVIVGLVLINIGLIMTISDLTNKVSDYKDSLKDKTKYNQELKDNYYGCITDNLRLTTQNNSLWELYYSKASDYTGEYEYYE